MLQYWLGNFMSLLSSTNFSFKITILKNIFQEYEQSVKQYARHFFLIWVQAVRKVHQRKNFSRQIVAVVGK